jgi:hypothetical protein
MTNCRVTYNTGDNPYPLRYEVRWTHKYYGKTIYGWTKDKTGEPLVAELEKTGRQGIEIVNLGEPE